MKKSLLSKILVVCVLVLGLSLTAAGCSIGSVSDAKAVLDAYENYAATETKLFENYEFKIKFEPNILTAIDGQVYNEAGELVNVDSHFKVIKTYNEIATKSTTMFVNWRNLLKSENDKISKDQANALYKKFVEFKNACKDLVSSVDALNRWDSTILHDNNVTNSAILQNHLDDLKEEYGKVIQKSFAMTNQFLVIYDSLISTQDFVNNKEAVLKNGDVEAIADHFTVEVLDAAFEIDGVQYALLDETKTEGDRIYNKHIKDVLDVIADYNAVSRERFDVENFSEDKLAKVTNALRLYQISLESYKQQKELFLKLTQEVDYDEYEELVNSEDDEKEAEDYRKLAAVKYIHNFVNSDVVGMVASFERLVKAVNLPNN